VVKKKGKDKTIGVLYCIASLAPLYHRNGGNDFLSLLQNEEKT